MYSFLSQTERHWFLLIRPAETLNSGLFNMGRIITMQRNLAPFDYFYFKKEADNRIKLNSLFKQIHML